MRRSFSALVIVVAVLASCASEAPNRVLEQTQRYDETIELPSFDTSGSAPLEWVLQQRRSGREYAADPLPPAMIGQLLWSAQGITDGAGHRTAPSAGARYPLEIYAVTNSTFMHYLPVGHRVELRGDDETLEALAATAFGQGFVSDAPVVLMIAGVRARTEVEYGAVAGDLVNRESGHAAQNVLLQATALGLVAVPVGGFDPNAVSRLAALPPGHEILYLIPVGFPSVAG